MGNLIQLSALLAGVSVWLFVPDLANKAVWFAGRADLSQTGNGQISLGQILKTKWGKTLTEFLKPECAKITLTQRITAAVLFGFVWASWIGGSLFWPTWLALTVVTVLAWVGAERLAEKQQQQKTINLLPHCWQLIAMCIEAGSSMNHSLEIVIQVIEDRKIRRQLNQVLARLQIGDSEEQSWKILKNDPAWQPVVADIGWASKTGTPLVKMLKTHAEDLQQLQQHKLNLHARKVSVKAVFPLVCCFLPAFMLVGVVPILVSAIPNLAFP